MKCLACDAENKDGAKFCRGCGATIQAAISPPIMTEPQGKPCPACQAINKASAKFCQKCGNNFGLVGIASSEQSSAPAGESVAPIDQEPTLPPEDVTATATASAPIVHETVCTRPVPPPAAQESFAPPHKKSRAPLIGALALLLCASAAGGYWWFLGNSPAEAQEVAQNETDTTAGTASSVLATTAIDPAPAKPGVAAAEESSDTGKNLASVGEASKPEPKPAIAKPAAINKPKRETVATVQRPSPAPEYAPAPAPDVKLDPQSESLLAMGEQMYASKTNSGALDAAKQVLRKYPGNPRATRLKNKAQAEIERQMAEARQRSGW